MKMTVFTRITLLVLLMATQMTAGTLASGEGDANVTGNESHVDTHAGIHVISWNWLYVQDAFVFAGFMLAVVLIMLVFHHCHTLSAYFPESCLLIVIGVIVGAIVFVLGIEEDFKLLPQDFMLYLLPPIILHAAYSLNDRVFANNLFTIMIYAVLGTILSCFLVGPTLYGLARVGAMGSIDISLIECLLFSSFIVAVDPVAVLAIFQEIKVNDVLYFLVFGESLLNDAVTVVLYNMMKAFSVMDNITGAEIGKGVASFFTISLGGLVIGLLYGFLTALITKKSSKHQVLEPLIIFLMAYMGYLTAELFHWSGIISMIGCGLMQAQFAFPNIAQESAITVKTFIHMISTTLEAIIFLFLGIELVRTCAYADYLKAWHSGFVLWSLLLCLVYRFLVVSLLTLLANWNRNHRIGLKEMFIMWYGGLRGAVCFALCDTLSDSFPHKYMFLMTTFVVILFTVFVQGITIKPLVSLCKIKRKEASKPFLAEEIQTSVMDYVMTGVECITCQYGENYFRGLIYSFGDRYLRRWLLKSPVCHDIKILERFQEIAREEHEKQITGVQVEGRDSGCCGGLRKRANGKNSSRDDVRNANQHEQIALVKSNKQS